MEIWNVMEGENLEIQSALYFIILALIQNES
jgi:hypothetical protein